MIDGKKVKDRVNDCLLTFVGNLVSSGEPIFDIKKKVWNVPVVSVHRNVVFPIEIMLNEDGDIIYAPTREKLIETKKTTIRVMD